MKRFILSVAIIGLLSVSGCGPQHTEGAASETSWGFLRDHSRHLIHVPNGSTIGVCGPDVADIGWAINTWATEIGRRYEVVSDCDTQRINNWVQDTEYAKRECKELGNTTAFARPTANPQELVDCGGLWGRVGYLHEVGHLFGLCDMYDPAINRCVVNNGAVAGAVMEEAMTEYLLSDDIAGIRALAEARGK